MTAYTDVGICNLALGKLVSPPISSISAPSSVNERRFYTKYPHWRDVELTKNMWLFALARQQLTSSDTLTTEEDGYNYVYPVPNDCLRPLQSQRWQWRQRGKYLLTPYASGFMLDYVSRPPEADFDPLFVEALASRLAFDLCEPITQSTNKKNMALQEYNAAISDAKRTNAIKQMPRPISDNEANFTWLNDRYN